MKNGGWVLVERTYGMYAELGPQRLRLCSSRVPREKVLGIFRDFVKGQEGQGPKDGEVSRDG